MPRYRSMVADDTVRPTDKQIESNLIVVPRPFRDAYCLDVDWEDFTIDAFGVVRHHCSLDIDRRIGVPLRGRIQSGDTIRLSVQNGIFCVRHSAERTEECEAPA